VPGRLFLIEDDLMFAQRARAAAQRLGVGLESVAPQAALSREWRPGDVVVLQATLRPEEQEALVEQLTRATPAPIVVAVTGHLETGLRRRLRGQGARLAAHSAMDRELARALGISDGGARDVEPGRPS
jgi:hypothetical protein